MVCILQYNSCMNKSGHLEGFSLREAHPQELIALDKGVSGKLDRITWRFELIAQSKKFSKKSLCVFSPWNRTGSRGKEEDEKPQRIEFLEGTDFLGAMMRRLNERDKEKIRSTTKTLRHRKEERACGV